MPDVFEYLSQNGIAGNRRVVQIYGGEEVKGFMLTQAGSLAAKEFRAHYSDGLVESISPPPDPDTRTRAKRVSLPASFKNFPAEQPSGYVCGSRYTGQMRRVVQCLNSRGLESKYGYTWAKSHGILEYPTPRIVGATPGEEAALAAARRYWIIEVSAAGVFAAPFTYGNNCYDCGKNLNDYLQSSGSSLDLSWAYVNKNTTGRVLRLLDAAGIAAAYANGSPWYPGMGWAFSVSGRKAANVVSKAIDDGVESNSVLDYYETRLIELTLDVTVDTAAAAIALTAPGVAHVVLPGHGLTEGGISVVSGADQAEYNGPHVVRNVTTDAFDFNVSGSPSSPATGDVRVANAAANAALSASLSVGAAGRVTFRRAAQGTLWIPGSSLTQWNGVYPFLNIVNGDGAVHVFYDGEAQIVTRWGLQQTSVPAQQSLTGLPRYANRPDLWDGTSTSRCHVDSGDPVDAGPYCQYGHAPGCTLKSYPHVYGFGTSDDAYTNQRHGFSVGNNDLKVDVYRRVHRTSTTAPNGSPFVTANFLYNGFTYIICPSCGSGGGIVNRTIKYWWNNLTKTRTDNSESATGTSTAMLFAQEREAIGVYRLQTVINNRTISRSNHHALWSYEESHTPFGMLDTPFDDFNIEMASDQTVSAGGFSTDIDTVTQNDAAFYLRGSGGISYTIPGSNGDLTEFNSWVKNTKETAGSTLYFLRGGMNHADPNLTPADQRRNSVLRLNSALTIDGGFTSVTGKFPAAFIGQV